MNPTIAVTKALTIAAPIERVWQAITTPSEIATWLGMERVTIDNLIPGGRMVFEYEGGGDDAIIAIVEPPTRFAYRWKPEMGYDVRTLVTFVLEATNSGTYVTVSEEGFESLSGDLADTVAPRNGKGWGMSLEGISKLVEGTPDD